MTLRGLNFRLSSAGRRRGTLEITPAVLSRRKQNRDAGDNFAAIIVTRRDRVSLRVRKITWNNFHAGFAGRSVASQQPSDGEA